MSAIDLLAENRKRKVSEQLSSMVSGLQGARQRVFSSTWAERPVTPLTCVVPSTFSAHARRAGESVLFQSTDDDKRWQLPVDGVTDKKTTNQDSCSGSGIRVRDCLVLDVDAIFNRCCSLQAKTNRGPAAAAALAPGRQGQGRQTGKGGLCGWVPGGTSGVCAPSATFFVMPTNPVCV